MVVTLDSALEAALREQANHKGLAPEQMALGVLRQHFLGSKIPEPRDDWERGLLQAARPWGISLSNSALSSEELYD